MSVLFPKVLAAVRSGSYDSALHIASGGTAAPILPRERLVFAHSFVEQTRCLDDKAALLPLLQYVAKEWQGDRLSREVFCDLQIAMAEICLHLGRLPDVLSVTETVLSQTSGGAPSGSHSGMAHLMILSGIAYKRLGAWEIAG
ncbi:hypothetical protein, partial [Streptomyces cinereoruber]|uniref:hypothetical protein n=1 Tax=Streptomyces cinereoruber TaxID=67260 RepID=UPI00362D950D